MKTKWSTVVAVALVLLLALVGTLQYRWIGDVSAAERQRLRESVATRATELVDGLDTEFTRVYSAFQLTASQVDTDAADALTEAFDRAQRESAFGPAVRQVFLFDTADAGGPRRFDRAAASLVPTAWPAELTSLAERLAHEPGLQVVSGLPVPPGLVVVDASVPALVVPIPAVQPPLPTGDGNVLVRTVPERDSLRAVVVWFDADRLRDEVVRPAVQRVFGAPPSSAFDVEVRRTSGATVYSTSSAPIDPKAADLTRDLLRIRLDALQWTRAVPAPDGRGDNGSAGHVSITIVRRGVPGQPPDVRAPLGGAPGWTLLVRATRGSVDAVVARSRTRNLVVSFGALAVLGAGLILLGVTAARERGQAQQQLAFVASVSHELKTPLAVIRSAAENLADGVVAPEQVGTYGTLIRDEGRRLSSMVDRVMDFAGTRAEPRRPRRTPVDIGEMVQREVSAAQEDAAARSIAVVLHPAPTRAIVDGDPSALRSAFANAIGNAVKYSEPGGRVDVSIEQGDGWVDVVVADRGIGIDADDLPRVFEPFFRGRRALDSQVRGSGLGLSIVFATAVMHGGKARIEAREGGGTVLTIPLRAQVDGRT